MLCPSLRYLFICPGEGGGGKPALHVAPPLDLQITGPCKGGFVPSSGFIALLQPSPHFCLLPHSSPRSLLPTPFYIPPPGPGPFPWSQHLPFEVIKWLRPHPHPIQPHFPPDRGTPPNFSSPAGGKSSPALSQAESVGGIGWGGLSGCPLSKGSLPEGPYPSTGTGVYSKRPHIEILLLPSFPLSQSSSAECKIYPHFVN